MFSAPRYVTYRERLSLDGSGQPVAVEVELPRSRDDAFDLLRTLDRLAVEDPAAWRALYRQYSASDWYVLNLLLSGGRRLDPFTGRVEADCDFQFAYAREMQFDGEGVVDKTARAHWKSHWRCYVGTTCEVLRNPAITIAIIAHEKAAAAKHGLRNKEEWENNVELRTAWDDVFYADPQRQSSCWNIERGVTVKRDIESILPTLSWHGIMDPPTGGGVGLFIFDDIENEATAESEEMREKTQLRFLSYLNLERRLSRVWINGTHHHTNGVLRQLIDSKAWRVRCHKAEDTTKPAPDIAAIYDECGGVLKLKDGSPDQVLPPEVRNIKLDGAPAYLHPMECALRRLKSMSKAGGLSTYYMQMMGDPLAGLDRRFRREWVRWYQGDRIDRAFGANLVMVIDGSPGVNDSTFVQLWALHSNRTMSWVDAIRKKLSPSEFGPAIFNLWAAWRSIGTFVEIRVEIYAQAVWDHLILDYFRTRGEDVRVVPIGRPVENRQREWAALEPLYRQSRMFYPADGIVIDDEMGQPYDVVEYFLTHEYSLWPMPDTDDGLAAQALLGEPENVQKGIGTLDFPLDEETFWLRQRSAGRHYPEGEPEGRSWDESGWWEGN